MQLHNKIKIPWGKKNFISWIKNGHTNQFLSKSPPYIFPYAINQNSISYYTLDTSDMSIIFLCAFLFTWVWTLLGIYVSTFTIFSVSIAATCCPKLTLITTFQFTCDLYSYRIFNDLKAGPSRPQSLTALLSILISFIYNLYKSCNLTVYPVNHHYLEVFHVLIIQFLLPHSIPLSHHNVTLQLYFYSFLYLFFTS